MKKTKESPAMPAVPANAAAGSEALIRVENLSVEFGSGPGAVRAVDDVSFTIGQGEIIGLVGESGSGKSTLGLALMRMVPAPGVVTSGRVVFDGRDLGTLSERQMREIRGNELALIVQDALATMNPVTRIEEQIVEILKDHAGKAKVYRKSFRERALRALRSVHLPNAELNLRRYPHQLSGGMQQRVAIAQGLLLEPKLIIADEPTTALDVTIQAQILSLLREVRDTRGASIVFVTHDLATVAEICDRVMVMYAGRIVESGTVREVFRNPEHPYTKALLRGLLPLVGEPPEELDALPGQPPRPEDWPSGCRFHPRCPLYVSLGKPDVCRGTDPKLDETQPHWAACHFANQEV
jgi:oligopeptide/dipeptide ABC transporter ATP-binding protein